MKEEGRCAEITAACISIQRIKMGTPGSGRKRTPVKDRFSAEDEALSNIAREAEARLAAKRAARAEARDIRMRELERQQKESSSLYSDPVAPARSYRPSECGYSSRASSVQSSPVLEEKSEKSHSEIFSRPSSRNSVSAAPQSGNSSRRGSGDASSLVDPDASLSELRDIYDLKDQIHDVEGRYMQGLKELKDSLAEVEEKYKKAMVSNAQLDNEKNNLIYQVDTLKDVIEEKEEQIAEFYRENEEKSKELERQKHTCSVLQHKLDELKEGLRQRDELIEANQRMQENIDFITKEVFDLQETINWKDKKIGALERQKDYFDCIKNERDELREELADLKETMKRGQKHGLVIIPDGTPNGDLNHESVVGTITVVSQEAAQVLESAGEGPLDIRLRKLAGEKEELLSQVRKLKMQLEEERQKYSKSDSMNPDTIDLENGSDLQLIEMQRDANRQISEYKFKLSKAEQDITTLEQNIGRLEGQVARYKNAAENAEKVEDELKAEKRKLQRELRTALDKIEEMEMTNSHLMKRLEKMKANRTALLSQQ
ncbi:leucine-rich repeat flightless-interacting protein 2 isoform X23 [Passer montanus]|uniref:leucine-rich repeat flightless-interacting protein 2 isoform X23 n=1 Tax=Passer montanus TaxID=9160 RepID=UPI00195F33E8|nr:leucine-rich repeat flightless-interacting protein 2 isoform X23 [Passer montanus]